MKFLFAAAILLLTSVWNVQILSGQSSDTVVSKKIQIYDCSLFAAFDFIQNEKKINLNYIGKFTGDPRHSLVNAGYPDTLKRSLKEKPGGETDGGEFGISTTFQINSISKNMRRFNPRLGLFYNYKQFFDYDVYLTNTARLDSLMKQPGVLTTDSVTTRHLSYSYYTEQIVLELGTNYKLYASRRFNIYTGILFAQGISFRNEFSTETRDSYSVDKSFTNGTHLHGTSIEADPRTYISQEPTTYATRIMVPFGIQHRFQSTAAFSTGFMLEGRIGAGRYAIAKNRSVTYAIFVISAGLRFSFQP